MDRPVPSLASLPRWGFAFPGRLRDELTALALAGTKTTTTGLLVEMELDGEAVPAPGDRSVVVDSGERPVAIVETIACPVIRLADVDDRHAIDEGEGYANAAEFRAAHERFWASYLDDLCVRLGDPSFSITDDTLVTAERFRVVARLDVPPDPASMAVRPVIPTAVPQLAGVLARAFARDPGDPRGRRRADGGIAQRVLRPLAPLRRRVPDLHDALAVVPPRPEPVVAAAPDGSFAAHVGLTLDEVNGQGIIEPVCTHPDHRQGGLAQALMLDGLRRLRDLGARTCHVETGDMGPANALYRSIPFTEEYRGHTWRLDRGPAS